MGLTPGGRPLARKHTGRSVVENRDTAPVAGL